MGLRRAGQRLQRYNLGDHRFYGVCVRIAAPFSGNILGYIDTVCRDAHVGEGE